MVCLCLFSSQGSSLLQQVLKFTFMGALHFSFFLSLFPFSVWSFFYLCIYFLCIYLFLPFYFPFSLVLWSLFFPWHICPLHVTLKNIQDYFLIYYYITTSCFSFLFLLLLHFFFFLTLLLIIFLSCLDGYSFFHTETLG